ncbi:MAG TPA: P-loop NTPase fold protein [Allosphingosinicella sp.]|nr:P-loop NTPase fold protein [Allosphingosinicella sp.]
MPSFARELELTLHRALDAAKAREHEYATLEHLLLALVDDPHASKVMAACGVDLAELKEMVVAYLDTELEALIFEPLKKKKKTAKDKAAIAEFKQDGPSPTSGFQRVVQRSILHVNSAGLDEVNGANVLVALFTERESYAVYFLQQQDISRLDAVAYITHGVGKGETAESASPPIAERSETATVGEAASLEKLSRIFRDDLKALSDSVPIEPVLNTPRIADKMVEFVIDIVEQAAISRSSRPEGRRPLLTIGLYGPWGSGKSTLLREVGSRMADAGFITVFVNSWKWDGGEDIYAFMNRELLRSLAGVKGLRIRALFARMLLHAKSNSKRWIAWLAVVATLAAAYFAVDWERTITSAEVTRSSLLALLTGAILAVVAKPLGTLVERLILQEPPDVDSRQTLSQAYRYFDLVRRMTYRADRKPIAFLFDDLDRCDDGKVVEFIKSIHSLTSDGSICVLACDEQFAAAAIYSQFKGVAEYLDEGKAFGARFLEKIIQVPFRLPEVAAEDLVALGLMPGVPSSDHDRETLGESEAMPSARSGAHAPARMVKDIAPPADIDPVSEARLSEICGSTLSLVVERSRLQIRQAKMLSNVVKLYSMVFPPVDEQAAQRLAAFLIITYVDPHWIPGAYFSAARPLPSELDAITGELRSRLGDDAAAIRRLYRLFGVRWPVTAERPASPEPSAESAPATTPEPNEVEKAKTA